jgi:hypothetical protein
VDAIFPQTSVRKLLDQELAQAGFGPQMFRNLNTPEDWQQAQRSLASLGWSAGVKPAGGER